MSMQPRWFADYTDLIIIEGSERELFNFNFAGFRSSTDKEAIYYNKS